MRNPVTDLGSYLGRPLRSSMGPALGRIDDVLADAQSRAPQWLIIRLTTMAPMHRALPLVLVLTLERGLVAPVTRRALRDSPKVRLGVDLTAQQELALHKYWMDH